MATIITKNSSTASSVPTNAQLVQGELAVNVTDKRLFTENASGTVVELGTNPSSLTLPNGTANGVAYLNGSKVLTTGSALTFDGTNLGLGVTPSAWQSGWKALQIGAGGGISDSGGGNFDITNNYYRNSGDFYLANGYATLYRQASGQHRFFTAPNNVSGAGAPITFTQAMTLDPSGYLAVGPESSGAVRLGDVSGGVAIVGARATSGNLALALRYTNGGSYIEGARIDSSGRMLVGTTSNTTVDRLAVISATGTVDTALIENDNSSTFAANVLTLGATRTTTNSTFNFLTCVTQSVAFRLHIRDSGNVVNQNNSYGAISDAKLKENVVDATPKLEKLNQVRVVNYNLIGETQKQIGVIAQELEQVFPGMVEESPDRDADGNDLGTTTKSVKYSVFVPMLIKAMQEQQAIINAQSAALEQLKADVAALKAAA